jgi:hypothetical protein
MRSSVGSESGVPIDPQICGQWTAKLIWFVVVYQLVSQLGRAPPMCGIVKCVVIFLMVVARVRVVYFF